MSKKRILREDFWKALRKKTGIHGLIGYELCLPCSLDLLALLEKKEPRHPFHLAVCSESPVLAQFSFAYHAWLQASLGDRIFIADGTAGQFLLKDNLYEGFYGFIDDAPELLQTLYGDYAYTIMKCTPASQAGAPNPIHHLPPSLYP